MISLAFLFVSGQGCWYSVECWSEVLGDVVIAIFQFCLCSFSSEFYKIACPFDPVANRAL
jgi:hypothetical protein